MQWQFFNFSWIFFALQLQFFSFSSIIQLGSYSLCLPELILLQISVEGNVSDCCVWRYAFMAMASALK